MNKDKRVMIKVLIADDHPLLRQGLKLILEETEDIRVAEEASDGEEVLDRLKNNSFDVMVLDINMPRKGGFEVLEKLKTLGNKIPVLILSTYSEDEYKELAMREGAAGYLTKEQAPEKLIDAIRRVFKKG